MSYLWGFSFESAGLLSPPSLGLRPTNLDKIKLLIFDILVFYKRYIIWSIEVQNFITNLVAFPVFQVQVCLYLVCFLGHLFVFQLYATKDRRNEDLILVHYFNYLCIGQDFRSFLSISTLFSNSRES